MARKTAKRKTGNSTPPPSPEGTSARTVPDAMEQKVLALAEQMGRLIGTVQTRAEGWLDPQTMRDQLTRIQDGAADLLAHLGSLAGKSGDTPPSAGRNPSGRSGGKVDAPGKKHRPPPPSVRPAKPSDDRVAKLKAANRSIRRPRQG